MFKFNFITFSLFLLLVLAYLFLSSYPKNSLIIASSRQNKEKISFAKLAENRSQSLSSEESQISEKPILSETNPSEKVVSLQKQPLSASEEHLLLIQDEKEKRLKELKNSPDPLKLIQGVRLKRPQNANRISSLEIGQTFFLVYLIEDQLTKEQRKFISEFTLAFMHERRTLRTRKNITLEDLESGIEELLERYEKLFLEELTPEQETLFRKILDEKYFEPEEK
jgi:hypothetical protein